MVPVPWAGHGAACRIKATQEGVSEFCRLSNALLAGAPTVVLWARLPVDDAVEKRIRSDNNLRETFLLRARPPSGICPLSPVSAVGNKGDSVAFALRPGSSDLAQSPESTPPNAKGPPCGGPLPWVGEQKM